MSDTQEVEKPIEPVPHIDVIKQAHGFFGVVHSLDPYSPQLVAGPTLDDLHRILVSVLVSEFKVSPERAAETVARDVRHVEDTIMAAHQRGVMGMSKQLQDANKALAAAKAELEELRADKAKAAAVKAGTAPEPKAAAKG
jgi:hypothetical protein